MFKTALTVAQLPAKATRTALTTATSPNAINALSTAIAQASIQTADEDDSIEVEGLTVNIEFNEERLLTTAGFSTACALGSVYWIGSKLKIERRYQLMIQTLQELKVALSSGAKGEASGALKLLDELANPLIDPDTLEFVDEADELKVVYESLFGKPAQNGSMFNTSAFTSGIDEAVQYPSSRIITQAAAQTDEVIEAMLKKSKPIAGKVASRVVGAILWVDTVWWVATSALDLGLNYLGIEEENQRIPILADLPFIGALFDLSDSVGSSFVDLVISPLLDGIISLFSAEDEVQILMDSLWGIITSAALNPTLSPFIIALLDFYIDDVSIDFEVPATFNLTTFGSPGTLDYFGIRPEPLDVLIVWLYAIVAKIVFKAWLRPAYDVMKKGLLSGANPQ